MEDGRHLVAAFLWIVALVALWYLWPIISGFFSGTHQGLFG